MTKNTQARRRLIQIVVRFQNAAEAVEARHEAAFEFDSLFDAGEFSGPATNRAIARDQDRLARRFGFENAEVACDVAALLRADLRSPYTAHGLPMPIPGAGSYHSPSCSGCGDCDEGVPEGY